MRISPCLPALVALVLPVSSMGVAPGEPAGRPQPQALKSVEATSAFATLLQLAALGPEAIGDSQAGDEFGVAMAVSGETVVIGAERDDNGADPNAGAAYVFVRVGNGWVQQAKLAAPPGVAEEFFGCDVDIDGDTLVVGAFRDNGLNNAPDRGAAYVFKRMAGVWGAPQKLVAPDSDGLDLFGYNVAISGGTIAVGAIFDDNERGTNAGAVYLFDQESGSFVFDTKLLASDGANGNQFGIAVDLDGDRLVVGADQGGTTAAANSGSAYVFTRALGNWTQTPELQPAGVQQGDRIGLAVAIDGSTVLLGAPEHDPSVVLGNAGAVFVYDCSTPVCAFQTKLTAGAAASTAGDRFGVGVAVDGDRAVIGADFGENANTGAGTSGVAYLYNRTGATFGAPVRFTQTAPTNNPERFGYAVAVDASLVAVGAFNANDPIAAVANSGASFLFAIDGIFSDGFEN